MLDYQKQLTEIEKKRNKLNARERIILEKRMHTIGRIAERFNLLKQSDELICGAFAEIEVAINTNSEKLKAWELAGKAFVKHKPSTEPSNKSRSVSVNAT